MFQFVKDTIKWALQTPTHYIQFHYLSNNNGACTRASPEHGSKRTDKSKFQINKKTSYPIAQRLFAMRR